jgi:hypothetical protein
VLKLFGLQDRLGVLLLLLIALPSLVLQWRAGVPRIDADGVEYYAHLRSLYFDRDVSFANEFTHFGIADRWDKTNLTSTGLRRTNFSVGPALLWMPFYAGGDVIARIKGDVQDGYSPWHIRAVCLGSLFYAVAGLMLTFGWALRLFDRSAAFWASVVAFYGTFVAWYAVYEATVSHAMSFCIAAVCLRIWWDGRERLTVARALALGLAIGLCADVRWQNGVLLLLPAYTCLLGLRRDAAGSLKAGSALLAGFIVGVLPQLLVFKAIFGEYLLPYPVQGRDYLRLGRPRLLETFFSSRHGLLFWTPVLWLSFIGLVALAWSRRQVWLAILAVVALMTWVNAASADWWAGGSFSNRRFDSVMPLLALGMAVSLERIMEWARRHPVRVIGVLGAALSLWNGLFMETYKRGGIPRDDTVSFADVTRLNAEQFSALFGSPVAWPANWLFARRTGLGSASYDEMVGKYLFFRQQSLGGLVDLGDPRVDPALLGEGFSARLLYQGEICRRVDGTARLFASLDLPEDLRVSVRAAGTGRLFVLANGQAVGSMALGSDLAAPPLTIPKSALRPQLNEFTLRVSAGGSAVIDRLVFTQAGPSR